jgi:Transposase DDE domain
VAGKKKEPTDPRRLRGFKYFRLIGDLLTGLKAEGTERDTAGNRELFFDQYATLLLMYFFNPTVDSLRGLREFTTLEKVQERCGVRPTSLGSLSEAARVFDPAALEPVIAALAGRVTKTPGGLPSAAEAELAGLIAVDGTLLRALPKMAWAVWQDAEHRAVKAHVAFAVFPGVPVRASVTAGNGSERDRWRKYVEPGGFYVADRGYASNALFREFDAAGARFVVRVQENATYEVVGEKPLTAADRAAGVVRDVLVRRLGTEKHNPLLDRPLRVVHVRGDGPDDVWVLVTNATDLSAQLVAVAYRYRWQVELFFRWLKCVFGCRHLLSECESGVTMQVYAAVIAALLLGLWTGAKPSKRTYEMLCHYLNGWATLKELDEHLRKERKKPPPSKR